MQHYHRVGHAELRRHREVNPGRIRDPEGVGGGGRVVRHDGAVLRGKGLLVQHGERGGTSYSLSENLGMPSPGRLEQETRQQVVLQLAGEGPVTNTLVRERLDISRRQAVDLLQSLVDSGQLVRTGERRGTRYEIPSRPG